MCLHSSGSLDEDASEKSESAATAETPFLLLVHKIIDSWYVVARSQQMQDAGLPLVRFTDVKIWISERVLCPFRLLSGLVLCSKRFVSGSGIALIWSSSASCGSRWTALGLSLLTQLFQVFQSPQAVETSGIWHALAELLTVVSVRVVLDANT